MSFTFEVFFCLSVLVQKKSTHLICCFLLPSLCAGGAWRAQRSPGKWSHQGPSRLLGRCSPRRSPGSLGLCRPTRPPLSGERIPWFLRLLWSFWRFLGKRMLKIVVCPAGLRADFGELRFVAKLHSAWLQGWFWYVMLGLFQPLTRKRSAVRLKFQA